MKERKGLPIENKVFSKKDIITLSKLFHTQYENAIKKGHRCSICYKMASSVDMASYESESLDLFKDDGIIDTKKISSIEMSFDNYTVNQYINLSIEHKGSYHDGLIIEGSDKNWVAGTLTTFTDIINSIKPQTHWCIKYKTFLWHLLSLSIGFIIFYPLYFLTMPYIIKTLSTSDNIIAINNSFKEHQSSNLFILYCLSSSWLIGYPWAKNAISWLLELWPKIEFDFGPEHMKNEKEKRNRLNLILSIVLSIVIIPNLPNLVEILSISYKFLFQK